jgi:hypothetical protein
VKSSGGLKDHYIDDIALQAYVLRGAGVALPSIELLHVNTGYVRGASSIVWDECFARLDVGEAVAMALADLPGRLPAMREYLSANTLPEAEPGSQCRRRHARCVHVQYATIVLKAAKRHYRAKSVISITLGKRTEHILSFSILGGVDNVHAEKPMQADPAADILIFFCMVGVGLYLLASFDRILQKGVFFYEATSVSGCSEFGEESSLGIT